MTIARAIAGSKRPLDAAEQARLHFVLRFAFGASASYTVCEAMGWQPSALAPVLTGVLLANIPFAPPFKLGLGLVLIMAMSASLVFYATALLSQTPQILFLLLGLVLFLAFAGLAMAKAQLPLTLLLICIAAIPVITLTVPELGPRLREVLIRAMGLAVIFTWIAHAIWPRVMKVPPPPPQGPVASPVATAALGTAIVLPLMLVYLMFGLTDAIPVLLTTILLVAKMEEERGAATAAGKMIGNFVGGLIAIAAYALLQVAPNLATFALIIFIISFGFAVQIAKGGATGGNALLAFNATMVVLGLFILKGPANSGTLSARLIQFMIACTFAVGMMALLWRRKPQAESSA